MDELPLFPVTAWEIGRVPDFDAVFIRFSFLSHALQADAEAEPGRRYLLNVAQARELVQRIDALLQKLESRGAPPVAGPRH